MNQRLRKIVNFLKEQRKVFSDADCARILEIGRPDFSQMMSGKRQVSKRIVSNLVARFPEINEEWLLTGEGNMLSNPLPLTDGHSISIAGEGIKENEINVNTDKTIERLIAEMSAQRKLTEHALAEIAAQRQLTETALKQNSDLIALLGKGQNDKVS